MRFKAYQMLYLLKDLYLDANPGQCESVVATDLTWH